METYTIQGEDRKDCELRIMEKYQRPFHIENIKEIRRGGFLGLFSREGVEVLFYFLPQMPSSLEEAKKKVIEAAGKNPEEIAARAAEQKEQAVQGKQILEELRAIKDKLDSGITQKEDHPSLVRAAGLLKLNDFSDAYTAGILDRARKELPFETLENFDAVQDNIVEWIGESIAIYRENAEARRGRIMALVGPTGVGKTTTIAKLAAINGLEQFRQPPLSVRMITIDAFRIGAREQIEKYGNIMDFPVSYIENRRELKKEIALFAEDTDLFLIDTIGKSPKDAAKLGEMKELLDAAGSRAEVHLVFSASTKTSDIEVILRQFEPFNYQSVVLTKLDETSHPGNVISALAERGKPVSFITDGQKVPNDIRKANVLPFLMNLDGFRIDREKIEKRFPVCEADQFQWS